MSHKNAFSWGESLLLSASSDETVNRRFIIFVALVNDGAPDVDGAPDADGVPDGWPDADGAPDGIEDGCDDSEGTKLGIEDGCDDSDGTKLGSDDGCPDEEGVKLGMKLGETVLVLELFDFLIFSLCWNKLPQVGEMLALKITRENFILDVCCVYGFDV